MFSLKKHAIITAKAVIMDAKEIASIATFHRKRAGLSQKECADLAGIGKTALFDIEHGKETVRFATLTSVLETLNITLELSSPLMEEYRATRAGSVSR